MLTPEILLILDRGTHRPPNKVEILITYENKFYDLNTITSRMINLIIKLTLNKIVVYDPAERYGIDSSLFTNVANTWQNVRLLKNPTLRAIRMKILHKDVWTNEKRKKLGISNDDKCTICGDVETTFHQLFMCENAQRMWRLLNTIVGMVIPRESVDFASLISVSSDLMIETMKACIFKLLIQIDRSSTLTPLNIARSVSFYLTVEYKCLSKNLKRNNTQTVRLIRFLDLCERVRDSDGDLSDLTRH